MATQTLVERKRREASTPPRRRRARTSRSLPAKLAAIGACLALWQGLTATGVLDSSSFASFTATVSELVTLAGGGEFWAALFDTLSAWLAGFLIASVLGVALGLVLGSSRFVLASTRFLVDFVRTVPPIALIPAALLMYGPTGQMKIILVVFGAMWPMVIQASYSVHDIDPMVRETARSYRISGLTRLTRVFVPAVLTFLAPAFRLTAVIALLLALASEVLASAPGIGTEITRAQQAGATTTMFAYICTAGLLGVAVNTALTRAERKLLPWHPDFRGRHS